MKDDTHQIHIIGAGISGLIAAIELEKKGYSPIIYEGNNGPGGRVRTDYIDGYPFDHGFQVLLTAYPAVKKYLDLSALNLKIFLPGAIVVNQGKQHVIGDPLRNVLFFKGIFDSSIASFSDKFKTLRLSQRLKQTNVENIFKAEHTTSYDYLKSLGFSERIILLFFKPFLSGIFLEPDLRTSSRMLEFVLKMLAEGYSAVPAKGMQSLIDQLEKSLTVTKIHYNSEVNSIENNQIFLKDKVISAEKIIIATDSSQLLKDPPKSSWKGSYTFYFEVTKRVKATSMIYLNSDPSLLINSFHYPTDLQPHPNNKIILSATVVKASDLPTEKIQNAVINELKMLTAHKDFIPIKSYFIPRSLPINVHPTYRSDKTAIRYSNNIVLAGDHLANGSLNAAIESGKLAAELILQD